MIIACQQTTPLLFQRRRGVCGRGSSFVRANDLSLSPNNESCCSTAFYLLLTVHFSSFFTPALPYPAPFLFSSSLSQRVFRVGRPCQLYQSSTRQFHSKENGASLHILRRGEQARLQEPLSLYSPSTTRPIHFIHHIIRTCRRNTIILLLENRFAHS